MTVKRRGEVVYITKSSKTLYENLLKIWINGFASIFLQIIINNNLATVEIQTIRLRNEKLIKK